MENLLSDDVVDLSEPSKMENLCDLPYDMLLEIAKQLKKLEDFTCFRSVSKSLSVVVEEEYFEGLRLRQRTPYLMLPVREDNDNIREFYSLIEGESTVASVEVAKFKTKKCFESLGWLLTVEVDGSMSLLDPFSGTEIPLPHQSTFPEYESELMDEHPFIQKMSLSSRPSETCDFVVMVIAGGCGHLAFWRLGDKAWNRMATRDGRCLDVVCDGNGQFYSISCLGVVRVINFARNVKCVEPRLIARCGKVTPNLPEGVENLYIMKIVDGSVHIITRSSPNMDEDGLSYITSKFQVYEVDIATGAWKEIYSLGSMAVFLGENSTVALDASRFPGGVIKANHIYFTDDNWEFYYYKGAKGGGMDIGVYSLETGTVEPIYPGEPLFSKVSPPTWITPCF